MLLEHNRIGSIGVCSGSILLLGLIRCHFVVLEVWKHRVKGASAVVGMLLEQIGGYAFGALVVNQR